MKKIIFTITITFIYVTLFAQNKISVCETKVTHLVCPEKVTYLLTGDPSRVIAEVVPEHPNMVRIKAAESFDGESSVTIVSANRVYSLVVDCNTTSEIFYKMEIFHSEKTGQITGTVLPEYLLKEMSWQVLSKNKKSVRNRGEMKDGIEFRLMNIFLKEDVLFFEIEISNKTNMGYDVENFFWWIDDKKQHKSVNVQEYQILPDYQHYKLSYIPAGTTLREVFVLPKLTIPDHRILKIELLEKALGNTGRKLVLKIRNKDILHARKF
jgi:conjugative transposon TraN protein